MHYNFTAYLISTRKTHHWHDSNK